MKEAWFGSLVCTLQTDPQAAEGTYASFWLPLLLTDNMEMWGVLIDIFIF